MTDKITDEELLSRYDKYQLMVACYQIMKIENENIKDIMDAVQANLVALTISPFSEAGIKFDGDSDNEAKGTLKEIKDGKWIR